MNDNFYKHMIEKSPIGYAYHKIICGNDGIPCDYEFIEINSAFEVFTGLKGSDIIGKNITEVLPDIRNCEFDWIKLYGEVAINNEKKEFEQFSEPLKKWYRVNACSPEKYYFITYFTDVSEENIRVINLKNLQEIGEEALQANQRKLTDIIGFLPDATFAIDKEKRIIIWNKAIEKMTGIPASVMLGKGEYAYTIPFYGVAQPQLIDLVFLDPEVIATLYPKLTCEGDTLIAEVFCPALCNGKGSWVYAKVSPLHDQFGNIIGAIESIRDINEQKLMMARLESKTTFFEAQTNASLDGILVVDENQTRILTNHRISEIFNVPRYLIDNEDDTLLLKHVVSLTKDPEQFLKKVNYLFDHPNETSRDEIEFKSGMFLDRYSAPVLDKTGKYYGRIWIFHDITERKNLVTALINEKNFSETTLKSVKEGVISTDNKGHIVLLNSVGELLTGWTREEAIGKPIEEVFNIVNEFTGEKCDNIVSKVLRRGSILESENQILLISKDGTQRPIEESAAPILEENGQTLGVVVVFSDFSEKKRKQEEILYLSYHDFLTGLYNRRFYEKELKRLDKKENLPLSLIMGDVNGLKLINDSLGHTMGDKLLRKVAKKITMGCRADDIVARLGGDEFIIISPKTDAFEAEKIIKRIKNFALEEKVEAFDISISFGKATKVNDKEIIQEIFKRAEDDMYIHKLYQSSGAMTKTIDLVMNTLYEKSQREMKHSKRVSEICEAIAVKMKFDIEMVNQIRLAGLMHDIGKMGIDEKILNKPGKLNADEWKEIQRHPEIGYRILSASTEFLELARYVLEHQEKWDGEGYPMGIKGEKISIQARIIGVADAYDAMTSPRTYGKTLNEEDAIKEIRRCAGKQFDPEISGIFINKVMGKGKK